MKADVAAERFHSLGVNLKQVEAAMIRNAELKAAVVDYARTRPLFEEYKAKKYSRKYLAEHEADIAVYRAAQAAMREILQGDKLPGMDSLKAEWQRLLGEKKNGYSEYRAAQKEMREVVSVKANIDHLLGIAEQDRNKEQER